MNNHEQPSQNSQEQYEQNHYLILDLLGAIKYQVTANQKNGQPKTADDVSKQEHIIHGLTDVANSIGIEYEL